MIKYKYRILEKNTGKALSDWYNYLGSALDQKAKLKRELIYEEDEIEIEKELYRLDF